MSSFVGLRRQVSNAIHTILYCLHVFDHIKMYVHFNQFSAVYALLEKDVLKDKNMHILNFSK